MEAESRGARADGGTGFRIGCQTITWGEGQRERLPEVFAEAAAAGFSGLEIGYRHLRGIEPGTLRGMLAEHGLVLAASHIGGNLEDTSQADGERRLLDEVLDLLTAADCGLLMYSGLRDTGDASELRRGVEALGRAAETCRTRGVRLLYHNHDWEFAHGARVMDALRADASDALGFCPDVGWVDHGGADVLPFLESVKERIGAIHFKDFAPPGAPDPFVTLGAGVAPLRETAAWLRTAFPNGLWVIAEQDRVSEGLSPAEAVRRNGAFLSSLFGQEVPHA